MQTSPLPIIELQRRRPGLFISPAFWRSKLSDIQEAAALAKGGNCQSCELIGLSAGGEEIHAFHYGELEPVSPQTTISSAMASDRPGSFYDPSERTKPSLALIGSLHGGETEGVALCVSLIHLLETGIDTLGIKRPSLVKKIEKTRLSIIPCLNPDGRKAAAVDHLNGAEVEDLYLVQQGIFPDGTLFRGRKVKEVQPIPPDMLKFRGGYYNADGVNLQHDDFFGSKIAPENQAIRWLFRREIPDAFMAMHAHSAPAAFLTPDAFLSPGYQRKQVEAVGFILSKLDSRAIPFLAPDRIVAPPWSFYFQTWLHHMTGATPLLFEFCHGTKSVPTGLEAILETGFVVLEAWLDYCRVFGPRPLSNELFGAAVPVS